jgi:hypothetical protein
VKGLVQVDKEGQNQLITDWCRRWGKKEKRMGNLDQRYPKQIKNMSKNYGEAKEWKIRQQPGVRTGSDQLIPQLKSLQGLPDSQFTLRL